ncbi:MAG TPA: hypothetical protein VGF16_00310 [Bryobacteraceae bacterium]
MKASRAALAALVLLIPQASTAAEDLPGAARELASKTSGAVSGPVFATYKNLSSLPDSEVARVRQAFESALPHTAEGGPAVEIHITLSENSSEYLLVEEIRKGDEGQVWIADWKRSERPIVSIAGAVLEKRLIWEQDEPMLDVAVLPDGLAVLTPSGITIHRNQSQQSVALVPEAPRPRDVRGRLRVIGGRVIVSLPGIACEDALQAILSIRCQRNDEPWVLESGSRGLVLANFAANRNYFDGRVVTQSGVRKTIAPFYSAASVEDQGSTLWLLALVDGHTQILDGALDPVASISGWGSDVAGIGARCGTGSQVLATRPGEFNEPDAVQAFSIVNHAAAPLGPPVTFAGPVTALWPSGPASALAISRDAATGRYTAYVLTMACAP